ncbi:MAG: type II toxin-antitoxin system VapC family toxin [Planctomycetota bacterium]
MILVDTSVWVEFLRGSPGALPLARLLEEGEVCLHPWVLGEVALGSLGSRRASILADLRGLPPAALVPDEEVLDMIDARSLAGRGIGWVDAHLLASTLVERSGLWTLDRLLADAARRLRLRSAI